MLRVETEEHFIDAQRIEYQKRHLIMLARVEEQSRNDGTYANASTEFKKNSADRIKNYINIRTSEEREMEEYQIFIDSMRKSLAVLS